MVRVRVLVGSGGAVTGGSCVLAFSRYASGGVTTSWYCTGRQCYRRVRQWWTQCRWICHGVRVLPSRSHRWTCLLVAEARKIQVFACLPVGGLHTGGQAKQYRPHTITGISGGIVTGGSADAAARHIEPIGGLVISDGSADVSIVKNVVAKGGCFTGEPETVFGRGYVGTGGLETSGDAKWSHRVRVVGSGVVTASGASTMKVTFAPEGVGGLTCSGTAGVEFVRVVTAHGDIRTGGSSQVCNVLSFEASGGLVITGGAARARVHRNFETSGGCQTGGSAVRAIVRVLAGEGGTVTGGTANLLTSLAAGLITDGQADVRFVRNVVGFRFGFSQWTGKGCSKNPERSRRCRQYRCIRNWTSTAFGSFGWVRAQSRQMDPQSFGSCLRSLAPGISLRAVRLVCSLFESLVRLVV